jgi:hypothetical protein
VGELIPFEPRAQRFSEDPVRMAKAEATEHDAIPRGTARELHAAGWVAKFDRLWGGRRHYYHRAGYPALAIPWAALNDLSRQTGQVGEVARAVRLGWVKALRGRE